MNQRFFLNLAMMIVLILVQVLICNHIMLFNVAMAFVFIYVFISLPMDTKVTVVLTWAFFSGLLVDLFSDTPGLNALACTLLAIIRKPCLYAYIPKDDFTKNVVPSLANLGFAVYAKYLLTLSAIYCVLVFTIEYFNFANVKQLVILSASSAVFTFLILLGIDSLIISRSEKRL